MSAKASESTSNIQLALMRANRNSEIPVAEKKTLRLKQTSDKLTNALSRLEEFGLHEDERVIKVLAQNPDYINRLVGLFRNINKYEIILDNEAFDAIATHASQASALVSVFNFLAQYSVDIKTIPLNLAFKATYNLDTFKYGIKQLAKHGLETSTINLLLSHAKHASSITNLIIELKSHYYESKDIEQKLYEFIPHNIGSAIDLLCFTLDKSIFFPDLIDILIRQQNYIDTIYEGARTLSAKNILSSFYFLVIEKAPKNANTFAKIVALLHGDSLIAYNDRESLMKICNHSIGVYYLLNQLNLANMLTEKSYAVVSSHHRFFDNAEVISALSKIKLFEVLSKEQLGQLLEVINKDSTSELDIKKFITILQSHLLPPTDNMTNSM
jgi:hypothetical protein